MSWGSRQKTAIYVHPYIYMLVTSTVYINGNDPGALRAHRAVTQTRPLVPGVTDEAVASLSRTAAARLL